MTDARSFVRNASGLVRELSFWDYFITNMNGVQPLASMMVTPWFIWFAVKGGDPILGLIGGLLFGLFGTIPVFAYMTSTFPRSAAPYVANSRILHPAIGWPSEFLMWFSYGPLGLSLMGGVMISWGLVPGLYTMGISSGNKALISDAFTLTQPIWIAVISVLVIFISMGFAILGTKRLARTFQLPATILAFFAVAIILAIWAMTTPASLNSSISHYLGRSPSDIITYAKTNYPAGVAPVSYAFLPILGSIAFTVGSLNTYWASWGGGEVRKASSVKTNIMAMAGPSILIFIVVVAVIALAEMTVGRPFLVSMTQILTYNPSYFKGVPLVSSFSTMSLVPMAISNNTLVQFIIMVGIIANILAPGTVYIWIIISRDFFAWSFDRILPSKFADVNSRTHTPVFNLLVNAIIASVFALIISFTSALSYALVATFATSVLSVSILMISAVVIPLRKNVWRQSTARNHKIGALPVIVIFGIVGFIYQITAVVFYTLLTPILGFGVNAAYILLAAWIIPFMAYWGIKYIRKTQGIDLNLVFANIPPE